MKTNKSNSVAQTYFGTAPLFFYLRALFEFFHYRLFSNSTNMKAGWKKEIAAQEVLNTKSIRKVSFQEPTSKIKIQERSEMLEEDIYPLS